MALTGASAFEGAAATAVVVAAVLVAAATALSTLHHSGRPRPEAGRARADWPRRFGRIGVVQGLAIAATVTHFVPLARLFAQPRFIATAAALCAVAAAGGAVLVLAGAQTAQGTVGLGAALVLWTTVLASRG